MVDDLDRVAVPAGGERGRIRLKGDLLDVAGIERAGVVIIGRAGGAIKRQGRADLRRDGARGAQSVFGDDDRQRISAHGVISQSNRRHIGIVARQLDPRLHRARIGIDAGAVATPRRIGGADRVWGIGCRPGDVAAAARGRYFPGRQLEIVGVGLGMAVAVRYRERDGIDVRSEHVISPLKRQLVCGGARDTGRIRGNAGGIPAIG